MSASETAQEYDPCQHWPMCVKLDLPRSHWGSGWWLLLIIIYGLVHWMARDVSQCVLNLLLGPTQIRKLGTLLERLRVLFQVLLIFHVIQISLDAPQDVISGVKELGKVGESIHDRASQIVDDANDLVSRTSELSSVCAHMDAPISTLETGLLPLHNYSSHADHVNYSLENASLYVAFYALIPYGWVIMTFLFASYAFVKQRIRYWRPSRHRLLCPSRPRDATMQRQLVCCLFENPRRVLKRVIDPGAIVALMFVASKVPIGVMGQWTCWEADKRILDVIQAYVSESAFSVFAHYATCSGPNPLRANLTLWDHSLGIFVDQVDAVASGGHCTGADMDQLVAWSRIYHNRTGEADAMLACAPINSYWSETFHDGVCDGFVAWTLWVIVLELFVLAALAALATTVYHHHILRLTDPDHPDTEYDAWRAANRTPVTPIQDNVGHDRDPTTTSSFGPRPPIRPSERPVIRAPSAKFLRLYRAFSFSPECPVCMNTFGHGPDDVQRAVSICGHSLCVSCVEKLVGDSTQSKPCPVCRKDLQWEDFRLGSEADDTGSEENGSARDEDGSIDGALHLESTAPTDSAAATAAADRPGLELANAAAAVAAGQPTAAVAAADADAGDDGMMVEGEQAVDGVVADAVVTLGNAQVVGDGAAVEQAAVVEVRAVQEGETGESGDQPAQQQSAPANASIFI